ncbi:MAG: type II toxin-antitoxin system TacA family antitoxin [Acidimicrobiales bacterium]
MSTTARTERFQLRATGRQASIIRAAARVTERNATEFLLEAATAEALRTLADQRLFLVSERVFDELAASLDAPPVEVPALRDLLSTSRPEGLGP